jgi:Cytochrome c554 and c-prime
MNQQPGIWRTTGLVLCLATGALVACCVWPLAVSPRAHGQEELPTPRSLANVWKGAGSCAAVACHNAGGADGTKGSEYSTWINRDPHRQAYAVLSDSRSRQIERNLHASQASAPRAERDTLCLDCHSPRPDQISSCSSSFRAEGVGCENCHGPAGEWLTRHYRADWPTSDRAKERFGMRPTKNLGVRSQVCADCHVGSPERAVTHDLIAAGHPALRYEFSLYLSVYPKHWSETADKARIPDLEARAWRIGQLTSAKVSLEMLWHRAAAVEQTSPGIRPPWPEFAEYDCLSCHHDLQAKTERPFRGFAEQRRTLNSPLWATWYTSLLPRALEGSYDGPVALRLVDKVREEMQKPAPNANKVAVLSRTAAAGLGRLAESWSRQPQALMQANEMETLLGRIARDDDRVAASGWDGAAQAYLAIGALYHAQGDLYPERREPLLRGPIEELGSLLQFTYRVPPDGAASPQFPFNSKRVQETLKKIDLISEKRSAATTGMNQR